MRKWLGCALCLSLLSLSFAADAAAKKKSTQAPPPADAPAKKHAKPKPAPEAAPAAVIAPAAEPARNNRLTVRAGVGYGAYTIQISSGPNSITDHAKTSIYGAGLNYSARLTPWLSPFADGGLEYSVINDGNSIRPDFVRTDATVTLGARLFELASPFIGYRRAWQDNSTIFDQDVWSEHGWYAGMAVGGFALGPHVNVSASAAYNWNRVKFNPNFAPVPTFNYNGVSSKLRFGWSGTPHAIELRYQKFSGDFPGSPLRLQETYAYLMYVFSWNALKF